MATFEIHGPQPTGGGEGIVATGTGFSFVAFLFAPLWLAAWRLWTPLALYALGALVVALAAALDVLGSDAAFGLEFAIAFLVGFEGPRWLGAARVRRGRPLLAVVEAPSAADAEDVFLTRRLASGAPVRASSARFAPQVLGLFPDAGRP